MSRDELCDILKSENILARKYFYPGCHRMEPYRSYFPHAGLLLPKTEKIVDQVLSLPTGTAVKIEDVAHICELIRFIFAHGSAIRKELHQSTHRKLNPSNSQMVR